MKFCFHDKISLILKLDTINFKETINTNLLIHEVDFYMSVYGKL